VSLGGAVEDASYVVAKALLKWFLVMAQVYKSQPLGRQSLGQSQFKAILGKKSVSSYLNL
jgi:hypothetical protein